MTNLAILRLRIILSTDGDLKDSGEIYRMEAEPFSTRSKDLARSMGSSIPFIVTASVMPLASRLSTWSFISDCNGEITTVSADMFSAAIRAGSWKVRDFPPPVGNTASKDLFSTAALTAFSCKGSPL